MKRLCLTFCILFLASCTKTYVPEVNLENGTLLDVRAGFKTELTDSLRDNEPLETPPEELFSIVQFDSAPGKLNAYLSKPTDPTKKQAAMIWITGGFPASGIDSSAWEAADPSNDQSAKAYREQGMIMMYPALRGCCNSAGQQEGFYGEVDDIIAAGKYLQQLDYVDPNRIFVGGHSTGGTLALLTAEATDMFRAVIAFGPVEDPYFYGPDTRAHKPGAKERLFRAPINFLELIRTPTIVIEGSGGNAASLKALKAKNKGKNQNLVFVEVRGQDHFGVLSPVNAVLAKKVTNLKADEKLTLTAEEITSN